MTIQIMDVIGERRLMMVILSNGQHAFVLGRSIGRAAKLVTEQIDSPKVRVVGIFDGVNMYMMDWEEE